MANTPSGKVREQINPLPSDSLDAPQQGRILYYLKNIFGSPVPFLQSLYVVALLTSMAGMEIFIWTIFLFTLIYIIVDRFSPEREFRFFRLGVEFPLIGFFIIVLLGLQINAPSSDFVFEMGAQRWMLTLYLLCYSFDLFPGLNKFIYTLIGGGTLVSFYAMYQHFSGVDLVRGASSIAVSPAPFEGSTVFQNVGFYSHHLTYGYNFGMLACFTFAAFLLSKNKHPLLRLLFLFSTLCIGITLIWTYGRGVWIAVIAAIALMTFYVSKKYFFTTLIALALIFGMMFKTNDGFKERFSSIWSKTHFSNNDRKDLWAANMEMFSEYPWLGIGYHQNEPRTQEYYKKLGITNVFAGHAHNNYIQMLATTGILGFAFYMIFIVTFVLVTHRLWTDIPSTHFWHRVIALGALGAQVVFHTGGLTQFTFGVAVNTHMFLFILAMVGYMAERYSTGIVPDDYSL